MNIIKYIIKWLYGFALSLIYVNRKDQLYWIIWGHIGEAVYSLSLLDEVKSKKGKEIHLLTPHPYEDIAELYKNNYSDLRVLKQSQIGSLIVYAGSHICFHKNIIGYSWYWDDNASYVEVFGVYIPGFLYKVRDLGIAYSAKHNLITNPIGEKDRTVQEIVTKYGIEKGKSVILIPYAKSAKMISRARWEELADVLAMQGLNVFTNVKDDSESCIKGTLPIVVPLKYIVTIVNYAGSAISIRCGLTDLLAVGNCDCETIYCIEDEVDETTAEIWTTKLGKENMLYKKKWYISSDDDFSDFLSAMERKYTKRGNQI